MNKYFLKAMAFFSAMAVFSANSAPLYAKAQDDKSAHRPGYSFPELKKTVGDDFGDYILSASYGSVMKSDIESDELPSAYDLRKTWGITSVKNQSGHGTCWAHSSAGAAETDLMKYIPDINLSELHTAFYAYCGDDQIPPDSDDTNEILDSGGNSSIVVNLWSQWIGPVYDSTLPYHRSDLLESGDYKYQSDFHLENAIMIDYNDDRTDMDAVNALVKKQIMEGHGVDATFYSNGEKCYDTEHFSTNSNRKPKFANHAIVIAGWDDNFPASDFKVKPSGNGAWLVKNSWGSSYGDDGYIWISYYDKSLGEFTVYDMGDKNNYATIYQHDSYIVTQALAADENAVEGTPSFMANVFKAEEDQQIEAVSSVFINPDTEYEVTVYTNLSDEKDPESGIPSAVTKGRQDMTGYFTIKLDKPVYVSEGSSFAVVMKLASESSRFVVPVETVLYAEDRENGEIHEIGNYVSYDNLIANTADFQSLYSADEEEWYTSSDGIYQYTDDEKAELLEAFSEQIYDGMEEAEESEKAAADMLMKYYEKLFEKSDLSVILGNISLKAFGNPCKAPEFSHISGSVPTNEKVELISADGSDIFYSTDNGASFIKYEQPIKIDAETEILTSENNGSVSRKYRPAKAEFFDIGYVTGSDEYIPAMKYARKTGENEYQIDLAQDEDAIRFYPVTDSSVSMRKKKYNNYSFTQPFEVRMYKNVFYFSLSNENALDNTVKVVVNRGEEHDFMLGDANGNDVVDAVDASAVLTHYALTSVGKNGNISENLLKYADFNNDAMIDSRDASAILAYYANESVG